MGKNTITTLFTQKIDGFKWDVCNMYSPCDYNERALFWSDLEEVRNWWSGPICFTGDVNAVISNEERNKREGDSRNMVNPLLCRLDRFLLSVEMDLRFPEAIQVALARVTSDHKPIMLVTKPNIVCKPYFKFENSWILHKYFLKKIEEWWGIMKFQGIPSFVFFKKLQNLKYFLKNWSREEFGGVKKKKEELAEKIGCLDQMEESYVLSQDQFEERLSYKLKLKNITLLEASKWHSRAKKNEFWWGDSNTSYIFRIANVRKKRNDIAKLEIEGEECFDQQRIRMEMRSYYESLFKEQNDVYFSLDNLNFPR
ncbi:uncharacterized protein LOC113306252 [Papaver somniferum]|uniref:uncharacterized protein LOC113306252 n=1 Tax=Papaver somniferum TaxID=3469 RepID=UPI000E6F86C7|nr:uncharacterized protein LOC113306252 [Papaver somniferum]